jgi:hypothetical protein
MTNPFARKYFVEIGKDFHMEGVMPATVAPSNFPVSQR